MQGLVIIDMQDFFFSKEPFELNEKICKQISDFKQKRWPIVVLEYRTNPYDPDDSRCGRTNATILKALKGYRNLAIFGKDDDDGSSNMRDYVDRCMHKTTELLLTGVNLDCCVYSTAEGLAANHPKKTVTILAECCGSESTRALNNGYAYVVRHVAHSLKHEMTYTNLKMALKTVEAMA